MNNTALLQRFDDLTGECTGSYENLIKSNSELRRALVRTYLWWHDCSQVPDMLDDLYAKHRISYKSTGNRPNFNPLLRIAFGKVQLHDAERNTISQWNRAVQELHDQHTANIAAYRTNAEGKLLAYFNGAGGISGIIKKDQAEQIDRGEEPAEQPDTKRTRKLSPKTLTDKAKAEIKDRALTVIKSADPVGTVDAAMPLRVGDDNLVALLGRMGPNGKPDILGSSNDSNIIGLLAQYAQNADVSHMDGNLRTLVETVRSQAYPSQAMPKDPQRRKAWWRAAYADQSKIKTSDLLSWTGEGKATALNSAKKLLVRGKQGDIVLSGSKLNASVVTRCKLKKSWLGKDEMVFLRISDRSHIEDLMENGAIHIVKAAPTSALSPVTGQKYSYEVVLSDKTSGKSKRLHFYDACRDADAVTAFQSYFDFDVWKPTWSCTVKPRWFGDVREKLLDAWFTKLGAGDQIKRQNNRAMLFAASPKGFVLHFNLTFEQDKQSAQRNLSAGQNWQGEIEPAQTMHLSKDLAPVLYNIADAEIEGDVQIQGDEFTLVFHYKTSAGAFSIAVPTVQRKSAKKFPRITGHFTELRYG